LLNDIKVGLLQVIRSGGGSHHHKYDKIKLIRDTYPEAMLTLIGDSGQQDPEIYERIAMEAPDRIKEIYIRDLHKRKRKDLLNKQRHLAKHQITMHLFN
jgi:phosphatidate phosphatase APP1